jgi:hypothetical protein
VKRAGFIERLGSSDVHAVRFWSMMVEESRPAIGGSPECQRCVCGWRGPRGEPAIFARHPRGVQGRDCRSGEGLEIPLSVVALRVA